MAAGCLLWALGSRAGRAFLLLDTGPQQSSGSGTAGTHWSYGLTLAEPAGPPPPPPLLLKTYFLALLGAWGPKLGTCSSSGMEAKRGKSHPVAVGRLRLSDRPTARSQRRPAGASETTFAFWAQPARSGRATLHCLRRHFLCESIGCCPPDLFCVRRPPPVFFDRSDRTPPPSSHPVLHLLPQLADCLTCRRLHLCQLSIRFPATATAAAVAC